MLRLMTHMYWSATPDHCLCNEPCRPHAQLQPLDQSTALNVGSLWCAGGLSQLEAGVQAACAACHWSPLPVLQGLAVHQPRWQRWDLGNTGVHKHHVLVLISNDSGVPQAVHLH